ncbi:Crp/Fnr family transcriptional regulator [Hansschlegelia beijingensis]|uniref:CRP-like cAMP-binding protein n=1 Tax=Hansschlegelia beijingensis TaxID=1133344 RepID=A0A7W6D4V4_9HYPH|nr:Crp/Fnr family transcriptional regulator [Hansschlegelia beijingensis]MBB3974172.1 CRP-like cAMP-binding protein [Hansschlegelia beijingensis]
MSRSPEAPPPAAALLLSDGEPNIRVPDRARQRPILEQLSPQERDVVVSRGRKKVLNRGATLFSQGSPHDGIYLIESGRIRVFYAAPSGREITLAYWYPGNFVGGPEIFGGGPHVWSGVASCNSSVLHLSGAALRELVVTIPALALGVIDGLVFKGKCYSTMAQMLGTRSITERLAHLLLHLADLYGVEEEDGGVLIAASFTHADLAHLVGATRQWVTISLKRFAERGIVSATRSDLVIRRPDMLLAMRNGEA